MLSAHDDSAENLWLTKHVVVGSRLIRDAGSTPAASTFWRKHLRIGMRVQARFPNKFRTPKVRLGV